MVAGRPATKFSGRRANAPDGSRHGTTDKIAEFVRTDNFALASGATTDSGYKKGWRQEEVPAADIVFESGLFLLTKAKAEELARGPAVSSPPGHNEPTPEPLPDITPIPAMDTPNPPPISPGQKAKPSITGTIPRESWNRVSTRLMPQTSCCLTAASCRATVKPIALVSISPIRSKRQRGTQIIRVLGRGVFDNFL